MVILHEIPRDEIKSILAEVLQDHGPRSRMEIFSRQAGYRTDAAMSAAMVSLSLSAEARSRDAAEGRVLPHIVASALPYMQDGANRRRAARPRAPGADEILKASSASLDREAFKKSLGDVLCAARTAPEGLPRWFFAVAVADTLLEPPKGAERFWFAKAAEMLCGILALAGKVPQDVGIHEGLVQELAALSEDGLSEWERQGWILLAGPMPPRTQESIFRTMIEALPHVMWPRQVSASSRTMRPGIMPTESWSSL